jgi:hypothetical protein
MKKIVVLIAVLVLFALPDMAHAAVSYYPVIAPLISPYSCTMTGFNLTKQQNIYRLTGPVYPPQPGYTSVLSAITFNTPAPYGEATLTLIPPQKTMNRNSLFNVPPLWIDYSFVLATPVQRLTIYMNMPFKGNNTPVTCLQTGVIQ